MNELVQATFDFSVLTPEQAQRTQDAELRIVGRTWKAITDNGKDLRAVKDDIGHGNYLNWIRSLGISESTSENWIAASQHFDQIPTQWEFENHALYLLSTSKVPESAREEAKQRAENGEKITEDVAKQIRDAHKQAEEARKQLWQVQEISQKRSEQLNEQLSKLRLEIELLTAKKATGISPEAQEKINKLIEQRDNLSEKVKELGEEARQAALKRNEEEQERKIRQEWRKLTKDFQVSVVKMLSQLPSPIDVQVFEADDWERLSQAKELARRFISECENLSRSPTMIVDAGWQVAYAVEP